MTDGTEDDRLMDLKEARIEAYKNLVSSEVFLKMTGDEDLAEEIENIKEKLTNRVEDNK